MSKKIPSICNRNLWQNNFNNEAKASTLCQQLSEQHDFGNYRRKFSKTSNATTVNNSVKRYLLTKEKIRKHNTVSNNTGGEGGVEVVGSGERGEGSVIKNINRTLNFKANSLQSKDAIMEIAKQKCKSYQNNHLHMHCQYAAKVLNMQNSQRHHYYHNHLIPFHVQHHYHHHHHHHNHYHHHNHHQKNLFDKNNNKQKTFNATAATPAAKGMTCCKKNDKNHCLPTTHNCDKLQSYLAKPSVSSSYPSELSEYHHNSQSIWLPQVSQHPEHLLGMFQMLPPVFLLKTLLPSSSVSKMPPTATPSLSSASGKYSNHLQQCNISSSKENFQKHQQQYSLDFNNAIILPRRPSLTPPQHLEQFNWNCSNFYTKQKQSKSQPSDSDVIFGNACLLLGKRYGWEKSRLEWLLKLEEEQKNNSNQEK